MRHFSLPLLCAACLAALLFQLQPACAASYSTGAPPRTGLESPDTPLTGRTMPVIGAFSDAYGNPITPNAEEKPKKDRLRNGAYGGAREKERPLPDPEDNRPLW